jgi:hypothetical protein
MCRRHHAHQLAQQRASCECAPYTLSCAVVLQLILVLCCAYSKLGTSHIFVLVLVGARSMLQCCFTVQHAEAQAGAQSRNSEESMPQSHLNARHYVALLEEHTNSFDYYKCTRLHSIVAR